MSARSIAHDVTASMARHLLSIAAALVMTPVLARTLGAARLGFWSLLGTCAFLLALCDLGLGPATLRASAGHDVEGAKRASRLAALVTGVLAVPVAVACAAWLAAVAGRLPAEQRADAVLATIVALGAGIVHAVCQAPRSYAHGLGRLVELARARAAGMLAQLVVTLALLFFWRAGLTAVAIGYAAGVVAEGVYSLRAASDLVHGRALPTAQERVELFRVARASLLTNVSVALCVRADVVILEQVTTLDVIGAYSVAARLVDQGFTLVKQLSSALVPRLGARATERDKVMRVGTMALGALAAAPLGAVIVAGAPLVVVWAGPAVDKPILAGALAWLGAAAILSAIAEIPGSAIALSGNPFAVARASVLSTVANVTLSVVGAWLLGPVAVAAATAVGNLVMAVMTWSAARAAFGASARAIAEALAPAVLATVVSGAVAAMTSHLALHPLVVVALASVAGLVAAAAWVFRAVRPGRLVAS